MKNDGLKAELSTEDINTNLDEAMDAAVYLLKQANGLNPMLEVVYLHHHKDGSTKREKHPIMFGSSIDFNDFNEKGKAMLAAGRKVAELDKGHIIALQATMMTEAWQKSGNSKENAQAADKVEVVIAATETWDHKTGILTRRIVRDTDDTIIGTAPSQEMYVTEKRDITEVESNLLRLFFVGFGLASIRDDMPDDIKKEAEEVKKSLIRLFS